VAHSISDGDFENVSYPPANCQQPRVDSQFDGMKERARFCRGLTAFLTAYPGQSVARQDTL